jgi:basic membrane protein A
MALIISLVGCNTQQEVAEATEDVGTEEPEPAVEPEEPEGKVYKVGLMVPSPITDQGWSQSGYEGILLIAENYDIEYSYIEFPEQSAVEENLRNFGLNEYDIVFAHGFNFYDAILKVAPEFPDTIFVNGGSQAATAPNLGSLDINSAEAGFLAGVAAAYVTETNEIAHVGGMEFPQLIDGLLGLEEGAKYINPDIEVTTAWVGDWADAAKAKGLVEALVEAGADVVYENAGSAGKGAIEGAEEEGIYAIGVNIDKNFLAPDTVLTSVIVDYPKAMLRLMDIYTSGDFEPKFYYLGAAEGTVYYAPFYQFEEELGEEAMSNIIGIQDKVISGEIDVFDYVDSTFYSK